MNDDGVIIFTLQIENDGLKKELMIRDGVIRKLENDCETLRRVIEKLEKEIKRDVEEKNEEEKDSYITSWKKLLFGE